MTPERWQRIDDLFGAAVELSESHRKGWLDGECGDDRELYNEVLSLLIKDEMRKATVHGGSAAPPPEGGGFIAARIRKAVTDLHTGGSIEGRRIGQYRVIRELGRGGMGDVYLAARADDQYQSQAAIKLVRPGLDTDFILRRFKRERQILARMQHPNIARLLDGGTTGDGLPYLVMEYVPGTWITKYAIKARLSIEQRLRLFLPVCEAVEYAHRNFIVHRDLKPGNILVDDAGSPKLLDFGISKLIHNEVSPSGESKAGLRLDGAGDPETHDHGPMTPDYASPEQISGEAVTIASDVYSLGAVLYELLSGCRPHRLANHAPATLERAICRDPLDPPSECATDRMLGRALAGDLDSIVMRAMQKPPARRYASVDQFATDIRAYLEHRPIMARPDSRLYRAQKFVRRNRAAVILGFLLAGALVVQTQVARMSASLSRGDAIENLVQAAEANGAAGAAYTQLGDRVEARAAYERAVSQWRKIESRRPLSNELRKEMDAAVAALDNLQR